MDTINSFKQKFEFFLKEKIIQKTDGHFFCDAIHYATMNGGKRSRPILCFLFSEMINQEQQELYLFSATAIELIHCYSLVHDDLPSMDNDILRRGKPTTHIKYNEATAILIGDALQPMAFDILSEDEFQIDLSKKVKLIQILSYAIGAKGMVHGQFLDMLLDTNFDQHNIEHIQKMHSQKTGALISASCLMGAITAGCDNEKILSKIKNIGDKIGTAFQLQDDILDLTESTEILGKTARKDIAQIKPTIPSLIGLDKATEILNRLYDEIFSELSNLPYNTDNIRSYIKFLVNRNS